MKQGEQEINWKGGKLGLHQEGIEAGYRRQGILLADTLHKDVLRDFPTGQSVLVLEPGRIFSFALRKNLDGGKKRSIVQVTGA